MLQDNYKHFLDSFFYWFKRNLYWRIANDLFPIKKIISIYCVLTGTSIFVFWAILLISNQVPASEWQVTYFHLIAEFSTAILLITSGIGLWLNNWVRKLTPISLGMLLYANINVIDQYIDQENYSMLTTIIITIIITVIAIGIVVRRK